MQTRATGWEEALEVPVLVLVPVLFVDGLVLVQVLARRIRVMRRRRDKVHPTERGRKRWTVRVVIH